MLTVGGALPGRTMVVDAAENAKSLSRALAEAVYVPAVV